MAYDEALAERIRALVGERDDLTEQKMFGGLAFLVHGNMAVAASGKGGLMVRVDPADMDEAMSRPGAAEFEMSGRTMKGWLRVDRGVLDDDAELTSWVDQGVAFAASLPAK